MAALTARQQEILDFIRTTIREEGVPPTVREIARHFGIRSPRAVSDHLRALERKGKLKRGRGKARQLYPVGPSRSGGIPVLGRVAAGSPILAEENVDGFLECSGFSGTELFALRIRGESMIGVGMMDNDYVIVDRRGKVADGDIAVVRVGSEATVKRIRYRPKGLLLQPENPDMEPTLVSGDEDIEICGRVVGLVRRM